MSGTILVGRGTEIQRVPDDAFVQGIKGLPSRMEARLAFMTRHHHVVRDFVVREMPRQPRPISPQQIALVTGLDLGKVSVILSDLERHLFFLVRDSEGNVSWAFPVTTYSTPHKLTFSSGERTSGAWAEDAFATSFVQGRLRGEKLKVRIDTECHHRSELLSLEVDEELRWRMLSGDPAPLLFEPDIRWDTFRGANIIHNYWNQTVFFRSEEHAREYRRTHQQPDGAYLSMEQAAFSERVAQAGLFAFTPDGQLRRWAARDVWR